MTSLGNVNLDAPYTGNYRNNVTNSITYAVIKPIEPKPFATNISLNPGRNASEINFTWWTPRGEAANTFIQVAKVSDLVGGVAMPVDSTMTQFTGVRNNISQSRTPLAAYDFTANKVTVTGLVNNTEYAYRVGDGNAANWSKIFTFNTRDPANHNVILFGDPQLSNSTTHEQKWRDTLAASLAQAPNTSFFITTGDTTGYANDVAEMNRYLAPDQLRNYPVMVTVGNHDTQSNRTVANGYEAPLGLLSNVYNWPNHNWVGGNAYHTNDMLRGGGDWYFSYGNTLYISLNGNLRDVTAHAGFMADAIASHPTATWRVVVFHQDIYGNGTGHSRTMGSMQGTWGPFLDSFDIDIVINGHDHTQSRSMFMKGNSIELYQHPNVLDVDEKGIYGPVRTASSLNYGEYHQGVYIAPVGIPYLTLGSAADYPKYSSVDPWQSWVAYSDPADHDQFGQYSVLSIEGETLSVKTYVMRTGGDTLHDSITLRKRATEEDLLSLIPGMEGVTKDGISALTWDFFEEKRDEAKALGSGLPVETYHEAYMALYGAYYSLDPQTDKTALSTLIVDATLTLFGASEGRWDDQYPVGSKAILQDILDAAIIVYELRLSTQDDIDAEFSALTTAYTAFLAKKITGNPCPWIYEHDIPSSGAYTIDLIDWMLETEPFYWEGAKQHYNAHFTKQVYSSRADAPATTIPASERTDVPYGPVNLEGGRGKNEAHIAQTYIGEWIRYELNVEQAGRYKATLGATNATTSVQRVVLRDDEQNVLTNFSIPASKPLPATGWADAELVVGDNEFYLPAGKFILEMFFINNSRGAGSNTLADYANSIGPNVDILTLERVGNMTAPPKNTDPDFYRLPFEPNAAGGSQNRQRGWGTLGRECSDSGRIGSIPIDVYNRITHLVVEVAGVPGFNSLTRNMQLHISNDGNGGAWRDWVWVVHDIFDPTIGAAGALVFDLRTHEGDYQSLRDTLASGWIDVAYYNQGWEELNYMGAYLILGDPPEDTAGKDIILTDFIKIGDLEGQLFSQLNAAPWWYDISETKSLVDGPNHFAATWTPSAIDRQYFGFEFKLTDDFVFANDREHFKLGDSITFTFTYNINNGAKTGTETRTLFYARAPDWFTEQNPGKTMRWTTYEFRMDEFWLDGVVDIVIEITDLQSSVTKLGTPHEVEIPSGGGPIDIPVTIPGFGGDEEQNFNATMNRFTGVVTIEADEEAKQALIDGALASGDENPVVTLDLSGVAGATALVFDSDLIELFSEAEVALVVMFPEVEVMLDLDAIEEIVESGLSGPLSIMATPIEQDDLYGMQYAQAGAYDGAIVLSIEVLIGGTKLNVPIMVSVPYELGEDEDPRALRVWYLNPRGELTELNATYNEETGMLSFKINHQSYFIIAYDPVVLWQNIFRDLSNSAWYYEAVAYVNHYDLFSGYGDGRFGPADSMTRAMFVTVLWNLEGRPVLSGTTRFSDVSRSAWYYDAVLWASENGIVQGDEHGRFNPEGRVTRQEIVVMLNNFAVFKKIDVRLHRDLLTFGDFNQIASWATGAARTFVRAAVINGNEQGLFMPTRTASRAEVAMIFKNFMKFVGFPGAYEYDESGSVIVPVVEILYDMADCLAELEAGPIEETEFLLDSGSKLEVTDDNPEGGMSLRVIPVSQDQWDNWQGIDLRQSAFNFVPGVKYTIEISGRIESGGLTLTTRKNESEDWRAVNHPLVGTSSGGVFSYKVEVTFDDSHFRNINPNGAILRFAPTSKLAPFTIDKLVIY